MNNDQPIVSIARTSQELDKAFSVRSIVFIEEQGVPYSLERDEFDTLEASTHFICTQRNEPVAAGRVRFTDPNTAKFERIAVKKSVRGTGIGALITNAMIEYAKGTGIKIIKLNAQINAVEFYRKFGFCEFGVQFTEAGILHIGMDLHLPQQHVTL